MHLGIWGEAKPQSRWAAAVVPCMSPALSQENTGQGGPSSGPAAPRDVGNFEVPPQTPPVMNLSLKHARSTCEPHVICPCLTFSGKNQTWNRPFPRKRRLRATAQPEMFLLLWEHWALCFLLYPNSSGVTNESLPRHTPTPPARSEPPLLGHHSSETIVLLRIYIS